MNDDTLPPLVQAVLDAVERHVKERSFVDEKCKVCNAWEAYDESRKPKERYTTDAMCRVWDYSTPTREWIAGHRNRAHATQHAAWLNAADRGELFTCIGKALVTREECERRVREADRNAREECIKIIQQNPRVYGLDRLWAYIDQLVTAIRASIAP